MTVVRLTPPNPPVVDVDDTQTKLENYTVMYVMTAIL